MKIVIYICPSCKTELSSVLINTLKKQGKGKVTCFRCRVSKIDEFIQQEREVKN